MKGHGMAGVRCPQCGQDDVMWVVGLAWITVTEDGAEYDGEPDSAMDWGGDPFARCPSCGHEGTWGEFSCEVDESKRRDHELDDVRCGNS